jgi:mannose-6-phosphate isomerase
VHAIGAGVVMAEIQQMSDATYRIFDWDRTGPDGRPRPMHREQAMESIDFASGPISPVAGGSEAIAGGTLQPLVRCSHFALDRLRLGGPTFVGSSDRFTLLVGLGGTAEVRCGPMTQRLGRGETMLLPASSGRCEVAPRAEGVEFLMCVRP